MLEIESMTLTQAARRLALTEGQVRRRVLRGELDGGQQMGRWWYVTTKSVEAAEAEAAEAAAEE